MVGELTVRLNGIIPAYAGQIPDSYTNGGTKRDHPRIRGTNVEWEFLTAIQKGSSPHTRDKFTEPLMPVTWIGIIPAYAGQIYSLSGAMWQRRDHPRIRGTNSFFPSLTASNPGSSPHTRDKFFLCSTPQACRRIIPAYAGQIEDKKPWSSIKRDHPRIRGTNYPP